MWDLPTWVPPPDFDPGVGRDDMKGEGVIAKPPKDPMPTGSRSRVASAEGPASAEACSDSPTNPLPTEERRPAAIVPSSLPPAPIARHESRM
jgi:hypothetical protein